jgi:hypothetical protein
MNENTDGTDSEKENMIECQLFDFEGWDQCDVMHMAYYDCTLKVPMLGFKRGEFFSCIFLNFTESVISLYRNSDDESPIKEGKLSLSVLER